MQAIVIIVAKMILGVTIGLAVSCGLIAMIINIKNML